MQKREQYIMNLSAAQEIHETSCRILGTTHFSGTKVQPEKLFINHILAIVFNGLLIIPTIIQNAVPLIAIWKSSQLNRKPCYFRIFVQSVIDLTVGLVGISLLIVYLWSLLRGHENYCFVVFI